MFSLFCRRLIFNTFFWTWFWACAPGSLNSHFVIFSYPFVFTCFYLLVLSTYFWKFFTFYDKQYFNLLHLIHYTALNEGNKKATPPILGYLLFGTSLYHFVYLKKDSNISPLGKTSKCKQCGTTEILKTLVYSQLLFVSFRNLILDEPYR